MSELDRLQRVQVAAAYHQPRYHVRPPRGFLNDPNGPVVLDGVVHLYFQSRPVADLTVPVEWGHATSPDFVHWQLHRPAMAPLPDGLDRDGCWSGNTVVDEGRIRAFYSGRIHELPYQSVLSAVSDDGGRTFGPPEVVVADPAPEEGVTVFRDPFVWRAGDGWRMAVGCGYPDDVPAVRQYASDDLRTWRRVDDLASMTRHQHDGLDLGSAWECPQVLELDGRTVVVVSTWTPHGGPMEVLALATDDPGRPALVDHGSSFYASSALRESEHGPLLFGWVREDRDQQQWAQAGWAGALSLPRQVWWAPDDTVRSAPVPSVDGLRRGPVRAADGAQVGAQTEIVVHDAPATVRLRFGQDDPAEVVELVLDAGAGTLVLDRTRASASLASGGAPMTVDDAFDPGSGRPAARVFVDGSVIEVFTSGGRVLTTRVYPSSPPPWTVEVDGTGEVWDLGDAS
ncbi:glycoside hydrolase family 32 protein [Microlunatus flavus]|uniref:beta-fructofuranosidase n=1 Tax=Microlunatus flavus TaxID=1036181 RepID=A0A1H9A5S2_9ACTN|nr:glycoside hydrolase family 32 protein [Microlunatus flavus]SEP71965.1 beta-fructofuranosidase [Microlunatus flavus]